MQNKYKDLKLYIRIVLLVICSTSIVNAVDSSTLSIGSITAGNWSLNNAVLNINHINQASPQLSLLSATLKLPAPLDNITLLNIRCQHFLWYENFLDCSQGKVSFNSAKFNIPAVDFSFQFKDNKSHIDIGQIPIFGGKISIQVQEIAEKWQILIQAKGIDLVKLYALLAIDNIAITRGRANVEIQIKGEQSKVQALVISALITHLSAQDTQEKFASEEAIIQLEFSADRQNNAWRWHSTSALQNGVLYIDPVYLNINLKHALTFSAQGVWLPSQNKIQLNQFTLKHPQAMSLQGNASLNYKDGLNIKLANVQVDIPQLKSAAPIYILPFLEFSALRGIELAGKVNAQLTIKQNKLANASIVIKNLIVDAVEQYFHLNQANAQIHWAKQRQEVQPSYINWQFLKVRAIPFQAGQLDFSSFDNQIKLLKQTNLAVLGGTLSINSFSFSTIKNDTDASINFAGSINELSLEQLSKALDWTPLAGTMSGNIPAVRYHDKTLSLDGELKMQIFDGKVTIKNLASSGLFTDFSQFYTDIAFDHLDLSAITQKFNTGNIEGRLSGTVQNLYLENWQPVSFYAWIGTPEDDDSTHTISQKAVENIASIGGEDISDILSRGFLGLFSHFAYSKLGIGCYLYQGVCQLMGVEAVDNGFYLLKGNGLPRINIIAHNPRLDWNILLNRLKRISASEEVIIE